jgi:membrane protein
VHPHIHRRRANPHIVKRPALPLIDPLRQPGAFALRVLRSFAGNQGLLLAGAVAYYALLSLIPLLILSVVTLSRVVDEALLFRTLGQYLEFLAPGQSDLLVGDLRGFLEHGYRLSAVLVVTMVFFSALAFTVLQSAMSVIFLHRASVRRRHVLISAVMPYLFVLLVGAGLLIITVVAGALQAMATKGFVVFGDRHTLGPLSTVLLYLLGVGGEMMLLSAIYLAMPVGRISIRHAAIGGILAGVLWEIGRHLLAWYFSTISQIHVVYGSFATAITVLLSVELAAIVLLLGAQVIAEYERAIGERG